MSNQERNTEWAVKKLNEFAFSLDELAEAVGHLSADTPGAWAQYHDALDFANQQLEVVRVIITDTLPGEHLGLDLNIGGTPAALRSVVHRAIGKIMNEQQLSDNWSSSFAISIDTSQMHPWVWNPARDIWEIGRYSEALQAAAVTVNARMQEKLGSDDKEFHALARSAFKFEDPTSSDARLRFKERKDWNDKTSRNRHEGAAALGEYIFKVWRNVPSHKELELPEELATEALAAMSTFARWVDESEVASE